MSSLDNHHLASHTGAVPGGPQGPLKLLCGDTRNNYTTIWWSADEFIVRASSTAEGGPSYCAACLAHAIRLRAEVLPFIVEHRKNVAAANRYIIGIIGMDGTPVKVSAVDAQEMDRIYGAAPVTPATPKPPIKRAITMTQAELELVYEVRNLLIAAGVTLPDAPKPALVLKRKPTY